MDAINSDAMDVEVAPVKLDNQGTFAPDVEVSPTTEEIMWISARAA